MDGVSFVIRECHLVVIKVMAQKAAKEMAFQFGDEVLHQCLVSMQSARYPQKKTFLAGSPGGSWTKLIKWSG
jgi:hypothetical protein